MSVKEKLQAVKDDFKQECPFCGAMQPMMIRGRWTENNEVRLYPDIGYSFCNCKDIFYTDYQNVWKEAETLNNKMSPLVELKSLYDSLEPGAKFTITMQDPFFCNWKDPHSYAGFNPRVNHIIWDADSFIEECLKIGFHFRGLNRDMDLETKTPECYHVHLLKP